MQAKPLIVLVAAVMGVTALAVPAAAEPSGLDEAVVRAMEARTGTSRVEVAAREGAYQVSVKRTGQAWAFGVAIQRAAFKAGDYPQGWLFLAHQKGREWTVALDGTAGFGDLAASAPLTVFGAGEKATFAARDVSIQALSNNTGLRLPYQVGQTWTLTQGPHAWSGSGTPYSSLDLAGGDGAVRAGADGTVYTMCADSSNGGTPGGWRRVYHANGYTTDYYHLWNLTAWTDGATLGGAKKLGNIGKNLCAGGAATGPHVHWSILSGTTRVGWHWKSAGQWVFWENGSGGGYALHGSTRVNVGQGLHNYGKLAANAGIVDANGAGTVNRRTGPGSGYPLAGTLNDGQVVTIVCWANGTLHNGRYGATTVWNRLPDGTWFSDAFAYTGVDHVGPIC